jgi:hypothetical protein
MTRSTRLVAGLLLIETILAGLWYWLVAGILSGDLQTAVPMWQAITTVSTYIGGAMGLFAALALTIWILMKKQRRAV